MPEIKAKEISLEIAKRVKTLRLLNAWTREELAERANINVYTLKRFEVTGQISFERLVSISIALGIPHEIERLFKPRQRINVDNWQPEEQSLRKRGRRRENVENFNA